MDVKKHKTPTRVGWCFVLAMGKFKFLKSSVG